MASSSWATSRRLASAARVTGTEAPRRCAPWTPGPRRSIRICARGYARSTARSSGPGVRRLWKERQFHDGFDSMRVLLGCDGCSNYQHAGYLRYFPEALALATMLARWITAAPPRRDRCKQEKRGSVGVVSSHQPRGTRYYAVDTCRVPGTYGMVCRYRGTGTAARCQAARQIHRSHTPHSC